MVCAISVGLIGPFIIAAPAPEEEVGDFLEKENPQLSSKELRAWYAWCRRRESNPQGKKIPLGPQPSASANSATSAFHYIHYITNIIGHAAVFLQAKKHVHS